MIKNIAFIPSYKDNLKNKIFYEKGINNSYEPFNKLKIALKKRSIEINTIDLISNYKSIDMVICMRYEFNLKKLFDIIRNKSDIIILVLSTEEISVAETQRKDFFLSGLFDRVLTWRDNELDGKIFHKYFYMNPVRKYSNVNGEKSLACIINSLKKNDLKSKNNIYSERLRIIQYFNGKPGFSLYGFNWGNYRNNLDCYKGAVDDKIKTYQKYKFAFAFENSNNELGGISEKIFDVMAAGCIPIYYGAPNISSYIPKKCFIDFRNFDSLDVLYHFIKNMPEKEILARQSEIKEFMSSKNYDSFNSNGFQKHYKPHN